MGADGGDLSCPGSGEVAIGDLLQRSENKLSGGVIVLPRL